MNVQEVLALLWRRKLVLVAVAAGVVGLSYGALQLVTPEYESTSTLVLRPDEESANDFSFFYALEQIIPIYANAATTRETYELARESADAPLGSVSVQTFRTSPIITITGRATDPERAQLTAQEITDALLRQVDRGDVGLPTLELTQIDRPVAASSPVFPRTTLTLLVAGLLGAALGVAAAFLRDSLASRVDTADELSEVAGVPVFAEIPHEPRVRRLRSPEALAHEPRYRRLHEALRDLRTNLQFAHPELKSVVVTSPAGRHGKTTIAFGLAVTYARSGARTLLVDGDLRRGRVAELLGIARGPGLVDVLRGVQPESAIRSTTLRTLDVLARGDDVSDAGEVLQAKFAPLLQGLQKRYDVVVIDATPVVPVNDARVMASIAEAAILVANAGSVTRRQVRTAVERLALVSVTPTAAVLNGSKADHGDYYEYVEPERPRRRVSVLGG